MDLSSHFLHGLEIPRYTSAVGRKKILRLLAIALQEFSQNGFTNASTNRIIRESGVSKGTLFNMFGSKMGLYLYLINRSTVMLISAFEQRRETIPSEFLQRLRWVGEVYLGLFIQDSAVFRFLITVHHPENHAMADQFAREHGRKSAQLQKFMFDGITQKELRIKPLQMRRIATMIMADIQQRLYQSEEADTDLETFRSAFMQDLDDMLEILRCGVYGGTTTVPPGNISFAG